MEATGLGNTEGGLGAGGTDMYTTSFSFASSAPFARLVATPLLLASGRCFFFFPLALSTFLSSPPAETPEVATDTAGPPDCAAFPFFPVPSLSLTRFDWESVASLAVTGLLASTSLEPPSLVAEVLPLPTPPPRVFATLSAPAREVLPFISVPTSILALLTPPLLVFALAPPLARAFFFAAVATTDRAAALRLLGESAGEPPDLALVLNRRGMVPVWRGRRRSRPIPRSRC